MNRVAYDMLAAEVVHALCDEASDFGWEVFGWERYAELVPQRSVAGEPAELVIRAIRSLPAPRFRSDYPWMYDLRLALDTNASPADVVCRALPLIRTLWARAART